jgi:hypothetical protein
MQQTRLFHNADNVVDIQRSEQYLDVAGIDTGTNEKLRKRSSAVTSGEPYELLVGGLESPRIVHAVPSR